MRVNIVPLLMLQAWLNPVLAILLPTQDPFYSEPHNISHYSPGDIIRSRSVESNLQGLAGNSTSVKLKELVQLLYRTTDSLGQPVAAVTSVLVPLNANPNKLLAYQTAYDSANSNCSPSFGLRSGSNVTEISDILFIIAALDHGWYITTSDYEGLQAQYVAGLQAGYATLDSVRATFKIASQIGLSSSARYAMWGYSGGSLACEWAAELQPSYAPELKFEGVALGGLVPNVTNVLLTVNNGTFAGLAFAGIRGLAAAYPNMTDYLNQHIFASKRAQFNSISSGCLNQAAATGAKQDLFSYIESGQRSLYDPVPRSVLAGAGQMGVHGTPSIPMFFYKALGDEVSPAADTTQLYNKLCSQGSTIEYHLDLIGGHISEAITGSASAFAWVGDRLNGIPVSNPGHCVREYVALTSLSIATILDLGVEIIALLQSLLG